MSSLYPGYLKENVSLSDLSAAFSDTQCAAISTPDTTAEIREAIVGITPSDIEKMRGVEIGLYNNTVGFRIHNREAMQAGDERLYSTYGLPLPIQYLLQSDFEDYANYTGEHARTRLVVGPQLELNWHADLTRKSNTPVQHRDLTGRGIFGVSANNGLALSCMKLGTTAFFNAATIAHHINNGNCHLFMQAAGERLLFRGNFVHRSHRTTEQKNLNVPQVRAITSYHPSRA